MSDPVASRARLPDTVTTIPTHPDALRRDPTNQDAKGRLQAIGKQP
jgi:hypothetical protein